MLSWRAASSLERPTEIAPTLKEDVFLATMLASSTGMESSRLIGSKHADFLLHWCPELHIQDQGRSKIDLEEGIASQREAPEIVMRRSTRATQVALSAHD